MSQTCSHIYDTGGACKSFAVKGQRYCVHHLRYRARRLRMAQARARGERFEFNLPPLESMHAVHSALSQLAEAIARGVIDSRSARDLLSVFRVASRNLLQPEKWQESLYHSDQPAPDIDVAAEFGLPADLDPDTPPDVAFPQSRGGPQLPDVGNCGNPETDNRKLTTDNCVPEMPFSGHYCGDHHSRECECVRIRADFPLTPEMVEIVEVTETCGPDAAALRSKQLMRNTERRRLNREHKRYEAIALERNMRRAADRIADEKLARLEAEKQSGQQPAPSKPPASVSEPPATAAEISAEPLLTPAG